MDSCLGLSRKRVRVTDRDFEETLTRWCDEVKTDHNNDSYVSDSEYILSDHNSDTDQEESEYLEEDEQCDENLETEDKNKYFYGKGKKGESKFRWSKTPLVSSYVRTPKHNIIRQLPYYVMLCSKCSNQKLSKMRDLYKDPTKSDLRDLDMIELNAFLGLLIYIAAFKSNDENITSLFSTDGTGRDIFRCVMNRNRFAILLQCFRFDDSETRQQRKENDPLAPISAIFEKFVANCQAAYTIGHLACVDEMLISFRGRSKFKMYIPQKPCKYVLKLMALTDSRNNYFYNGYLYCGKKTDGNTLTETEKKLLIPTQAELRLSIPIQGSNRNITDDNWFSSIELVNVLKTKNLTYIGTLKKNKSEIPPEFQPNKTRQIGSSLYGFPENVTLLSHVPKKQKAVLLVSSMHSSAAQDPDVDKPEMIHFYNTTKSGVDSLDQKCALYSTGRRTQRWPMAIFFRILDICAANAYILFKSIKIERKDTRLEFMKNLGKQLITEELERRQSNSRVRQEIKVAIRNILGRKEEQPIESVGKLAIRKYCSICPKKLKRKTYTLCSRCRRPVCLQCSSPMFNMHLNIFF
ncbi:uncharacterized protein LOC130444670 [Diorhabda sublineata]|uniref:uncharacterized protein LOC130444670 n=1 Tax=Diorhabda sublineata TaxID=1163346 RepID=UPI0024E0EA4E|nr:uncharacterized protein LOC130444670 [Diorhabda sublineata]